MFFQPLHVSVDPLQLRFDSMYRMGASGIEHTSFQFSASIYIHKYLMHVKYSRDSHRNKFSITRSITLFQIQAHMSRSRSRSPMYRNQQRERSRSVSRSPSRTHSRSRSPVERRSEQRHNDRRGDRYDDRRDDRRDDREPRRSGRDNRRDESTSVLVRHLNFRTTVDELRKIFGEFGEVVDVYLPLDYHTRRPRGFGFVQFSKADDAEAARRSVDQTEIDGSRVEVVIAQQNRKSPGTMRRFGRRGDDRYDDRRGGRGSRESGYSRREERRSRRSYSRSRSAGRNYRDDRRY